jgi:5-methylcytosine-specific restriction endonuclease McrA
MALATAEPEFEVLDATVLGERARDLASQISQLEAELVGVVQQIARCPGGLVDMTVRQYVGWQAGLMPAEAARLCRLASQLEALPLLTAELASGRVSSGTAALLASVATPDNEANLIDTASVATGRQLQTLVRAHKANLIPDDEDRPEPVDEVSYGVGSRGRWRMRADLAPELGAQIEAALRAEKQAALDDGATEVSNAEALVGMAQAVLGTRVRRDGILPERFQIILHVDADGDGSGGVQGGGHLEWPSVTELLCESWITVVTKRKGQPITITSPTRLATPAQQRALLARDRTCRFPGCGRSFYLKAHHIVHREHGGPTQIENLVLLCQTHHTLIHKPGWRLERDRAGKLWFTAPDGRLVLPTRRDTPPRRPPPASADRPYATYDPLTVWGASVVLGNWQN